MKAIHVFLTGLIIFIISLTQTAVLTDKGSNGVHALVCLLLGWAESSGGKSWFANPLIFTSWIFLLFKKTKISIVISLLATCLALSYLSADTITVDEAGHKSLIAGYGAGFYLWISSCVLTCVGGIALLLYPVKSVEPVHNKSL
ncbi:hypothetical protein CHRYSEOSP005_22650 [Chryseobacterium sp. Alg-005]|uniref:hypothetical protein n=1 Tax=Chryseobacterium sp. Alg-005 TaxID=3159516 RepID=UPI003555B32D